MITGSSRVGEGTTVPPGRLLSIGARRLRSGPAVTALVVATSIFVWHLIALVSSPLLVPSPLTTIRTFATLVQSGDLQEAVTVSYARILTGWTIGCSIAIPIALIAGRVHVARLIVQPYISFFRFVPPIALLGVAILWLGIGEEPKLFIIMYTSSFTVFLNTMAGAMRVSPDKIRAARSLGAGRWQVLRHVVLPATIPSIVTGMRIGMGFSFMAVVAAELVATNQGIGHLIFNARLLFRTDVAFAGILTLGFMGLTADLVFRSIVKRLLPRHDLQF